MPFKQGDQFVFTKIQISWTSLVAGCLLAFATTALVHRRPADLNMDGAPAAMVPGYTGPLYSAQGKLVGYAQPPVVNLQSKLKPLPTVVNKSLVSTEKHPRFR
jgi:hypothetical protein